MSGNNLKPKVGEIHQCRVPATPFGICAVMLTDRDKGFILDGEDLSEFKYDNWRWYVKPIPGCCIKEAAK